MIDEIDYQNLFESMRSENERLRINILKLKNDGYTLRDKISDWIESILDDPYVVLYIFLAVSVVLQVVPTLTAWIKDRRHEK
jgi:hypothetical protein